MRRAWLLIPLSLGLVACSEAPPAGQATWRIVTFRSRGSIYMGTRDKLIFDGERPLDSGMTTMRVDIPSDPAEIEFVAGRSTTPEFFVTCRVGTETKTTIVWNGAELRCETR